MNIVSMLKRLNDLSLGFKLTMAFIIMAVVVAVTGFFGIWSIGKVGGEVKVLLKSRAYQEKAILNMELHQKACRVNLLNAALVRSDLEEFNRHVEGYKGKNALFKEFSEALLKGDDKRGLPPAPKGGKIEEYVTSIKSSWADFEKVADELIAHKGQLLRGGNSFDDKLADLALNQITEASETAKLDIDDLADFIDSQMITALKESDTIRKSATYGFIAVIILAVIVALGLGILFTRLIVTRIKKVAQALQNGAEGDLTTTVEATWHDEIGKLGGDFNEMTDKLSGMLGSVNGAMVELTMISANIASASSKVVEAAEIQASSVNVTSSAMTEINTSIKGVGDGVDSLSVSATETSSSILEMAASIEEVALNIENLSQSVEEVSSSIVEMAASIKQIGGSVQHLMEASSTTASSISEMDYTIKQVEQNAMETADISKTVRVDAVTGKQAVEAAIAGINEIRSSSRITSDVIENLSRKAEDIGGILSVIDEVAEQTNLLALNAAIIAAQAGEHGKGFAVVADEIKELADRTTSSTREIAMVIRGVQEETRRAVEAINMSEQSISQGEALSEKAGEALEKIVVGVERASDQVAEIARATVEQARGSQMIKEAMDQVSDMVSQIANATTEQGRGSDLIMAAVERMKGLTGQVKTSAREQSKVGSFIAQSTENITQMIAQIKRACDEQTRGSEQVVRSVEDIQSATVINLDSTRVMGDSVNVLSGQIAVLKKQMAGFKVKH
jgi:methyl-accepting chemotaxis protein